MLVTSVKGLRRNIRKIYSRNPSILLMSKTAQLSIKVKCADAIGYLAVYRLCFVVTLFFLLMALVMIGVRMKLTL